VREPDGIDADYDELLERHGHKAEFMRDLPSMLCGFFGKNLKVVLECDAVYEGELVEVGLEGFVLSLERGTLIIMYEYVKAVEIWGTTKKEG